MSVEYLLHESPVGYAVFKVQHQADTVGNRLKEVQEKAADLSKFGKLVSVQGFSPFQGAAQALENQNDISEGICSDYLKSVIELHVPNPGKKKKVTIGVQEKNLAGSIKANFPYVECETAEVNEVVADLLRGLRLHAPKLLKQLQEGDVDRAQLGLGHAYSRAKVKFSVQKNDNHIIQAIATLDQLDKAVNLFCMRVREWYGWHFPELVKIVSDNHKYVKLVLFIGDKSTLADDKLHDLAALVDDDEGVSKQIIDAARVSMGRDISETDMDNVMTFAKRAASLSDYRKSLSNYLVDKMSIVAPNLAALIGDTVAARLISKAGSLTNLSKYAASTVQILGAEKALFRALKTKGNTPKYGLIYHSSFIGRAGAKNKGRISRFLANKCTIASRIDNFSENPTAKFGEALRQQVEERLEFYQSGTPPTKNEIAMKNAMDQVLAGMDVDDDASDEEAPAKKEKKEKKSKKSKDAEGDVSMADAATPKKEKKDKKKSKDEEKSEKKKRRHSEVAGDSEKADKKEKKKKRKSE
ncbi:putative pre-rRNA processing nucleolar protein Sik1 [Phyllosticta citricarpa]